jgi:prefoldin subunit 5
MMDLAAAIKYLRQQLNAIRLAIETIEMAVKSKKRNRHSITPPAKPRKPPAKAKKAK